MEYRDPNFALKELFKLSLEKSKENAKFSFNYSDKLIIWLIGFSVAGISLIIGNLSNIKALSIITLKFTVILLSLCVIFGVLFRLTIYFITVHEKKLEFIFQGYFADFDITPIIAEEISNASVQDMVSIIKMDFGLIPSDYTNDQQLELNALKKFYLDSIEFSKKKFYIRAQSIAELFESAFKIKKEITLNNLEIAFGLKGGKLKSTGYNAKRWIFWSNAFFFLTIICFVIIIVVTCLAVVKL